MKKTLYILSAVLVLAACAREEVPVNPESSVFTIRAAGEGNTTKTSLQEDGSIFWEDGDAIKAYFMEEEKFTTSLSAPSRTADFIGTQRWDVYANRPDSGFDLDLWALYPYESAGEKRWTIDKNETINYIETAVPPIQTASEGTFDRTAFLSAAQGIVNSSRSMGTLTFYNVCGGIKFSILEEGVEKVVLFANGGEKIAGDVRVSFDAGGNPYCYVPSPGVSLGPQEEYNRIELRAPDGETFRKGKWYCIACIPGTLEQGFTLRFSKKVNGLEVTAGEYIHRDPVTVKRAVWGKVGDADEGDIYTVQLADNTILYTTNNGLPAGTTSEGSGFDENGDPTWQGFYTWEGIVSHTYDAVHDCYVLVFDDHGTGELPPYFESCQNVVSVQLPGNISTLGEMAFYFCTGLKEITLPARLNHMKAGAFQYCSALEEVTLPDNAMTFGKGVFTGCNSLASINIPEGTKILSEHLFSNCSSLQSIELPSSLKGIRDFAFSASAIKTLAIPDGVEYFNQGVFSGCSNLESFTMPAASKFVAARMFYGCQNLSSVTMHDNIEQLGQYAFYNCGKLTDVTWPDKLEHIGEYCFVYSGIEEAVLPEGLQGMGDNAFACSALKKLVIPSTVTQINSFNLFADCVNLEEVTLPPTLTAITSSGVFSGCTNLRHIDLPEDLNVLGYWTFMDCGLESFTLPKNINVVVESLLAGCKDLTEVKLHEGVTLIQGSAFYGCSSLEGILLPSTLTELRSNAFTGTGLKEIVIPEHVTEMGEGAFSGCHNLRQVNIPSGVTAIKNRLFSECSSLEELTLPEGIRTIGYAAFIRTGLKDFTLPSTVEVIEAEAFYQSALEKLTVLAPTPPRAPGADISSNFLPRRFDFEILVPAGSVDAYKEADGWSNYADIIQAIE